VNYKTITILFLTITVFGGCWNNRCTRGGHGCAVVESSVTKEKSRSLAFRQFVDSIPILNQKFKLDSDSSFTHFELQSNFIPDGAALIGRLLPLDNHEFILYSYPADLRLPILEVYTSLGEKVNQRELFLYSTCDDFGGHHSAQLSNDRTKFYLQTTCKTALSNRNLDTVVIKELIQ
jgi:hypothetical protein